MQKLEAIGSSSSGGFTLLELLVVIGLIAALSFFLIGSLTGGGTTASLQSAQATVANLVTAARTKAPATGRKTRLLVNVDPAVPERFLRFIVLQLARQTGPSPADWETITAVSLPEGVYVLPATLAQPAGLVTGITPWKSITDPGADLVSELFRNQTLSVLLDGDTSMQTWTGIAFTPNGTLAALGVGPPPKGTVVLTIGTRRAPGSYLAGESPVQLGNPQAVRGLLLSAYGVPTLLDERSSF